MKNYEERFGANLRRLRSEFGLTQLQLAEALGYSEKSVSKWECASGIPGIETLYALSEFFRVSIDELFREDRIYLLGIDAGGTKTDLLLTERDGTVIRQLRIEGANPADIGIERARELLRSGIRQIAEDIKLSEIVAYIGSAGGTKHGFGDFFDELGFMAVKVSGDIENIIAAGLGDEDGVAMIMGTGVIAYSQKNGQYKNAGGWGYLFDEGGSAYDIAREGFAHYFRAADRVDKESLCSQLLGDGVDDPRNLLKELYSGGKRKIASYAPVVFRAASQGDAVAESIIDRNMEQAACFARAAADVFHSYPIKVVIAGGLTQDPTVIDRMKSKLEIDGKFKVELLEVSPVYGALRLAGQLADRYEKEKKL